MKFRYKTLIFGVLVGCFGPFSVIVGLYDAIENSGFRHLDSVLILTFPMSFMLMPPEMFPKIAGYIIFIIVAILNLILFLVQGFLLGLIIEVIKNRSVLKKWPRKVTYYVLLAILSWIIFPISTLFTFLTLKTFTLSALFLIGFWYPSWIFILYKILRKEENDFRSYTEPNENCD